MFIAFAVGVPLGMWAGLRPDALSSRAIMTAVDRRLQRADVLDRAHLHHGLRAVARLAAGHRARADGVDLRRSSSASSRSTGCPTSCCRPPRWRCSTSPCVIRLTRAGVGEVLHADYVRFARAKGLPARAASCGARAQEHPDPGRDGDRHRVRRHDRLRGGDRDDLLAGRAMGKLLIDAIEVLDRPLIVGLPDPRRRACS